MGPSPLSDDEIQAAAAIRSDDAVQYCEEEVGDDAEKATRYYRGDISQDLPDIPGRSRVVSRDLRDTVMQIMPSIMRVFFGQERSVEYCPVGPEDEEGAKQATDYANFILTTDNDAFTVFHSVFKDALIRRAGIVKVYWKEVEEVEAERFSGINPQTFSMFEAEAAASPNDIKITEVEAREDGALGFVVQRTKRNGYVCVEPLPREEFIIARDAKSSARPSLIGHRTMMTVSDLVAMGYDFAQMVELAGTGDDMDWTGEEDARRFTSDIRGDTDAVDPSMLMVEYRELYMLIDADGDGIAEMRKVCLAGPGRTLLKHEVVSDHPFADFCPEPEPHTFFGLSLFDVLQDIQLIRSQLLRLALDGLSSVVTPRMVYLEGQVNMKQLQDARPGGLIGTRRENAIYPLPTDKAAPQMAMEGYRLMGEVRQERTGQNQASMGLTPDALQSVSRIASNELVQSAQARVEMICRFFANGMKRVHKLILSNITRYQDSDRMIRLRNKFVPMDPRQWNPAMDVTINVGLGKGNVEERALFFRELLQMQQAVMQQAGLQNPWFGVEEVRNTMDDLIEAAGRTPDKYLKSRERWAEEQQRMAQSPPPPPKPDPAEILAKVEQENTQAKVQMDREQQQFDMQMELLKDDRERDKLDADIIIKASQSLGVDPQSVLAFIRQQRAATPTQVT